MDSSKPLATESFSYSWLTQENRRYSSSDIINLTSFLPQNSTREQEYFNFDVPQVTEISSTTNSLVHADEIFLDGKIKPFYNINRSSSSSSSRIDQALKSSTSVPSSPFSSRSNPILLNILVNKNQYLIKKWRKSSKRILQKCFGFVKPLWQTLGSSRKNIRVNDVNRKVCEIQRWRSNSVESSPRNSCSSISADNFSVLDWDDDFKKIQEKVDHDVYYEVKKVKSCSNLPVQISPLQYSSYSNDWCEVESSIHEAILYCKRSVEK